jgi:hypothetical protein
MKDYGIRVKVALPHGEAVARTKEALQAEGFGILRNRHRREAEGEARCRLQALRHRRCL